MVSVFDYTDYRAYLKDFYLNKKKLNPKYSYRFFAKKAGIKGQSFLDMVINGKRNLSLVTIDKFVKALELNKKEAHYFSLLVGFNQAKKEDEKSLYFEKLVKLKGRTGFSKIDKSQYLYFTNRFLIIIREMVSLPHFKEDPEWISQVLNKAVTPVQVKKIIEMLIKMKLLKRNKKGVLQLSQGAVTAQPDFESLEALQYYRSVFHDAKEAVLNIPFDKREVRSLTIPMPESLIPKFKEKLQSFFEEIAIMVNNEATTFDEVYQVTSIFYPVTESKDTL